MFYKGQKLVCIKHRCVDANTFENQAGPSYMEVVTHDGDTTIHGAIYIVEYNYTKHGFRAAFQRSAFRPAIGNSCIDELVTKEEVKETSDLTIKVPETV